MADKTGIEWTDATWNPVTGCAKVSAGCKNCYAERDWKRLSANPKSVYFGRAFTDVQCHPERLTQPLKWRDPKMIFVNSMSDLFHEAVPFEFIAAVFGVMMASQDHTYQILTKRPARMRRFFEWAEDSPEYFPRELCEVEALKHVQACHLQADDSDVWPLPNVWLGVSVENQEQASKRIPVLLKTPAAVRWISAEPLLGELDLSLFLHAWHVSLTAELPPIDWVVAGGESGPNARASAPDWFRWLRDQCEEAGVAFFFKQKGEWDWKYPEGLSLANRPEAYQDGVHFYKVGKKLAGRELDGRTWDEYPAQKKL